jgi:hypothetical protein
MRFRYKFKNIRDLCRDITDFKLGYEPRTNIVNEEKGDMVTDSHSILARWKNSYSQLFSVHGVNGVRQTAKPLVQVPVRLRWLLKT